MASISYILKSYFLRARIAERIVLEETKKSANLVNIILIRAESRATKKIKQNKLWNVVENETYNA